MPAIAKARISLMRRLLRSRFYGNRQLGVRLPPLSLVWTPPAGSWPLRPLRPLLSARRALGRGVIASPGVLGSPGRPGLLGWSLARLTRATSISCGVGEYEAAEMAL